ncbi:MAG TPA: adenylate/guanylate cyclase domain-containing protein [Polyangiaceae bacterium]|nr:adenylate/guanylate cyclase domain-containing protein [Polyangiaceae bacterium]
MTQPPITWNEDLWRLLFAIGHPDLIAKQKHFQKQGLPPRCRLCMAPFGLLPVAGWGDDHPGPSNRNPRFCSLCDQFIRANPGGAKVTMTMVFTDVRGSTALAESLGLEEYVRRINAFYRRTTSVFVETDGFMMDVVGDEVFALYPSGFSGVSEADSGVSEADLPTVRTATAAKKALGAVQRLVDLSKNSAENELTFGVAVHTAPVYIGTIRGAEEGISDVRVWGIEVNKAARMCAQSGPGEALLSAELCEAAGFDAAELPTRVLELKGISQPVRARVWA